MSLASRRNILISGTSRGLGLALAEALTKGGHDVVGISRRPGNSFCELNGDLTKPDTLHDCIRQLSSHWTHIDLLIHNAGVYPEEADSRFADLPHNLFKEAFETNVLGTIALTREALPLMEKSSTPRIVVFGSGIGSVENKSDSRSYCYGPSKAALHMWARTLSFELTPPKWIVSVISPGWVRTEMGGPNADLSVDEVIPSLSRTILNLSPDHHGHFINRHGESGDYKW